MSNSSLVTYTKISPNKTSPRNNKIDTISIHCVVGQLTAKQILNLSSFTKYDYDNGCSCNYAVGRDGSIGLCVEERDRSWCTSNAANDNRAITIEVASDTKHPYKVNSTAYKALINLLVDVCKRNGIKKLLWKGDKNLIGNAAKQNMTVHRWFANKACPGDYLYNKHGEIAEEVNARLASATKPSTSTNKTTTSDKKTTSTKTTTTTKKVVKAGAKLKLKNVALYVSSTAKLKASTILGTYYVWDDEVINNRVRITNAKSRVGKAGMVTGWIAKSHATTTTTTTTKTTTTKRTYKAGAKMKLASAAVYVSPDAKSKSGTLSGTYYAWDSEVVNNRVRVTNAKSRVGKAGQVTGWIAKSVATKSLV